MPSRELPCVRVCDELPPLVDELEDDDDRDGTCKLIEDIREILPELTTPEQFRARWALTDYLLAWPHYLDKDRRDDLDLPDKSSERPTPPAFEALQTILNGHLKGVDMPWVQNLSDNLIRWKVANVSGKGLGLVATGTISRNTCITIYGGTIFDKDQPLSLIHISEPTRPY